MLKRQWARVSRLKRYHSSLPASDAIKEKFTVQGNALCIRDLLKTESTNSVILNGWIDKKPKKVGKDLNFGVLRDPEGDLIQLVDSQSLLKAANVEDVVQIEGQLSLKRAKQESSAPEYEIKLSKLRTLNKAGKKPSQLLHFKEQGNYPPEHRYLQLRLPKYQTYLRKRHEIATYIREHLNSKMFSEIETPILFKSTPEGAREFLVPTRNKLSEKPTFYALPQSPQQYKQLLMAGGVSRYYQLARCFRDEDLRSDRQPEFTQVDLEMAFASGSQVMDVVESTITNTWNSLSSSGGLQTIAANGSVVPVSDTQPVHRMTYQTAMSQYGIDKPDLRFPDLKIVDLSEFKAHGKENSRFPVFEVLVFRNAFETLAEYNKIWAPLSDKKHYKYRAPIMVPIDSEHAESTWFESFLPTADFENPTLMTRFLNLKKGDIVCGSTRETLPLLFENPTPLGRLRQLAIQSEAAAKLDKKTENAVAAWVIDFPLFSPVEKEEATDDERPSYPNYESARFTSTHHPFTMVQLKDLTKLSSNPLLCTGQHYDFVVNGTELGGGSTRIHDPELQNFIFKNILKISEPEKLFGHLLTAFESGTPPHAGFAIGFDRLCAMICGTDNIRDVIAFPKSISGSDLVVGSPSTVPEATLNEYNVAFKKL